MVRRQYWRVKEGRECSGRVMERCVCLDGSEESYRGGKEEREEG